MVVTQQYVVFNSCRTLTKKMNDKLWSYILCKNGKQKELLHWNIKQLGGAIEDKILGTTEAKKKKKNLKKVKSSKKHTRSTATATAKSLQSCPTLWDPIDSSPPGFPIPRILQARTLEWVAISFSNAWKWKAKVKSFSHFRPSETPWTAAFQAPPSMGFSRQEYWSGVPLPSPNINCHKSSEIFPFPWEMGTNWPWNWSLTVLKRITMKLMRALHDQFQDDFSL